MPNAQHIPKERGGRLILQKNLNHLYGLTIQTGIPFLPYATALSHRFIRLLPKRGSGVKLIKDFGDCLVRAAAIVGVPPVPLVLQTADCIPCIAYGPDAGTLGLAHFGYRELLTRAIPRFIAVLRQSGGDLSSLRFIFGPSICTDCYTHLTPTRILKWHVLKYLTPFGSFAYRTSGASRVFDLTGACLGQFLSAGIAREQIEILPYCTRSQNSSFHHRGKESLKVTTIVGPRASVETLSRDLLTPDIHDYPAPQHRKKE